MGGRGRSARTALVGMSSPFSSASVVEMLVLAVWLGAAVLFAAIVAPALFAVLPSRAEAGDVVGRVLPVLLYSGLAVTVAVGGREVVRGTRGRAAAALVGAAASGCALLLGRQIDRVRESISGPVDSLSASDPRRVEFGRLHGMSVGLLGVAMLAVFILIALLVRDPDA